MSHVFATNSECLFAPAGSLLMQFCPRRNVQRKRMRHLSSLPEPRDRIIGESWSLAFYTFLNSCSFLIKIWPKTNSWAASHCAGSRRSSWVIYSLILQAKAQCLAASFSRFSSDGQWEAAKFWPNMCFFWGFLFSSQGSAGWSELSKNVINHAMFIDGIRREYPDNPRMTSSNALLKIQISVSCMSS